MLDKGWHDTARSHLIKLVATDEQRELRQQICESCEHFKIFMCKVCGCYMPFKVRIQTSACPKGKW